MNADNKTLLEKLLMAYGPGGQEDEVRAICKTELARYCDEVTEDRAGDVVGRIKASRDADPDDGIKIMAHLDEIAMVVKLVDEDGTLQVQALGGAQPISFGAAPVDILGDSSVLPGVLSFGSMHSSGGSQQSKDVLQGNVQWSDVHVVTRRAREDLANAGVRPGTRVVLSKHWRAPWYLPDAIAAHFLDDRAPLLAVILTAKGLSARRAELNQDVWLVCTTLEEESNAGAMYAASRLPGDTVIAVEVGPVLAE